MKRFAASIVIRASAETIWTLLTDAGGYPQWNSTVERIDGRIEAGATITVHAKVAAGRAFPVRVAEFKPPIVMTWVGGMPLGLFTGVRRFTLAPAPRGEVEFGMEEIYGGLLSPLFGRLIPDLQPAFDTFVADLKRRAESKA